MKTDTHPNFNLLEAVCVCGNRMIVGSTMGAVAVEICEACHPFYTGQQKIVDTEGRVERFNKRFAESKTDAAPSRKEQKAAAKLALVKEREAKEQEAALKAKIDTQNATEKARRQKEKEAQEAEAKKQAKVDESKPKAEQATDETAAPSEGAAPEATVEAPAAETAVEAAAPEAVVETPAAEA